MALTGIYSSAAARQIRTAALVVGAFASLSLLVGISGWRERNHLDLELLLGFIDSLVVLSLAYALWQQRRIAAWGLLVLAAMGIGYTLWVGSPLLAILPQAITIVLVSRALGALNFLRDSAVPVTSAAAGFPGQSEPRKAPLV